ncbi:MAG: MFS transporter [Actinobacteria bacterium]|nr:MFS transporter [Actinomycetota bacterium]
MAWYRGPIRWVRQQLGDESMYPVLVLAGLNLFDELDRAAFGLFGPEIVRDFDISAATLGLAVLPAVFLGMGLPVALGAATDRYNRVRLSIAGGFVWCLAALATGIVGAFWLLVVVRMLTEVGRGVSGPTHNSMLSDYYAVAGRGAAFSIHQNANPIGNFLGLVVGGAIAGAWGWQTSFLILPLPGIVFLVLMLRLHEPRRGAFERKEVGEDLFAEADPLPIKQAIAQLWSIRSWRRYAYVWLFLWTGYALAGVLPFYFQAVFGVGPFGRGAILGSVALLTAVGGIVGGIIAQRLMARDEHTRAGMLVAVAAVSFAFTVGALAFAPTLLVAVSIFLLTTPIHALAAVAVTLILSATMPVRIRGQGFGTIWFFAAIGYLFFPVALSYGDLYSFRVSLLLAVPPLLIATGLAASAARFIGRDIARVNRVGEAEIAIRRRKAAGEEINLLEVVDLDVAYGDVQVLFGVNMHVAEGEIVALLGTNGAGKSTLLRAVSGLIRPRDGVVLFDGEDITGLPAETTTERGIIHVPGGRGVFPGLTVAKNLRLGAYLYRKDEAYTREAYEHAIELFPRLGERLNQPAGTMSGGEQQMLTLAQAFVARPRILAIDELSLGLAPVIVEDLLEVVERINRQGITVILVEQSVNIALELAERAYFMEKGEMRFEGAAGDLLERDDIVRSVFLAGAGR